MNDFHLYESTFWESLNELDDAELLIYIRSLLNGTHPKDYKGTQLIGYTITYDALIRCNEESKQKSRAGKISAASRRIQADAANTAERDEKDNKKGGNKHE